MYPKLKSLSLFHLFVVCLFFFVPKIRFCLGKRQGLLPVVPQEISEGIFSHFPPLPATKSCRLPD